jgi:hypothetical protein
MTATINKAREGFFGRQRNTLFLSAAFLLIFICQNYFEYSFTFIFEGKAEEVGKTANSIRKISQGLVNIIGIAVVNWIGYHNSFISGTVVAYPLIFLAAWLHNQATERVKLQQASLLIKALLWCFSAIQGAGHSIIWIAQGCYIATVIEGAHCAEAFSTFAFFYNFTYPCGNVLMKFVKIGEASKYTSGLIMISLLSLLALPFYFLMKKHKIDRSSQGSILPFTKANLGANLWSFCDILTATLFMGVVIGFIGTEFCRPLLKHNDLSSKLFEFFLCYGLFACVASLLGSWLMNPKSLAIFATAACILHIASIGMFQLVDNQVKLQGAESTYAIETLGYLCYAYSACYGLASSTYITLLFTLVARRYEANMTFAMWLFQVLNCLATGLSRYPLKGSTFRTFIVSGILGYGSVFYTLYKINLSSQEHQAKHMEKNESNSSFPI